MARLSALLCGLFAALLSALFCRLLSALRGSTCLRCRIGLFGLLDGAG